MPYELDNTLNADEELRNTDTYIEQVNNGSDELYNLGLAKSNVESEINNNDSTDVTVAIANTIATEALKSAKRRLGIEYTDNNISKESYSNVANLYLSTEGIKEVITTILESIKNMLKKVWEFISKIFNKIKDFLGLDKVRTKKFIQDVDEVSKSIKDNKDDKIVDFARDVQEANAIAVIERLKNRKFDIKSTR